MAVIVTRTEAMIAARIALFVLTLAACLFILVAGTRAALAATLKPDVVISGDVVTVADIFDGLTRNGDYVLGRAPEPGKDLVLNARTLYRIASALDIDWRPQHTGEQVTVRRAATIVLPSRIEDKLKEELRNNGALGQFNVIPANNVERIVLPADSEATFDVTNMRYEPHNDFFEATIVAPSRDNPLRRMVVSGQVEKIVSLPVLRTTMKNGDLISMGDLTFIDVPVKSLPHDAILDADRLGGYTPRRVAAAGKPLSFNDIQLPQLVGRGEMVTLIFKHGTMEVATRGKSMQNGARGDLVQVTNVTSNKSLAGVVTGLREITVQ